MLDDDDELVDAVVDFDVIDDEMGRVVLIEPI